MPLALLVLAALASAASATPGRPRYLDCVSSSECGPWECCLLGEGRYSLPKCTPMADVGDPCLPDELGARPLNTTIAYPDGQEVNLLVFRRRCPCVRDLRCDPDAGACAARAAGPLDNTL